MSRRPAFEAAATLLKQDPFAPEDVASVTVWTYDPATRLSGGIVTNGYAAKHSIPYNVAARLVYGVNDLSVYTEEAVADSRIQSLVARIKVQEDPALTAMLPDIRPARVEVTLNSGAVLSALVERPRGGFDNPPTEDELLDKFRRLAGMAISEDAVEQLIAVIPTIPGRENLDLMAGSLMGETT